MAPVRDAGFICASMRRCNNVLCGNCVHFRGSQPEAVNWTLTNDLVVARKRPMHRMTIMGFDARLPLILAVCIVSCLYCDPVSSRELTAAVSEVHPTVANDLQPADLFKKFVESPPPIADLFYDLAYAGEAPSYFHLKWQLNAMFYGDIGNETSLQKLANVNDLTGYQRIFAKFNDQYWQKIQEDVYVWTNRNILSEANNTVKFTHDNIVNVSVPTILNFGCAMAPVASIRWVGDSFFLTNHLTDRWVRGQLSRDELGRANRLLTSHGRVGSAKQDSETFPWIQEYHYEASLSLAYLPSRIKSYYNDATGMERGTSTIRIHSIAVADEPMPQEAFALDKLLSTTNINIAITVSNQYLVFAPKKGKQTAPYLVRDGVSAISQRPTLQRIYFITAVLLIAVPFVIFLLSKQNEERK